MEYYNDIDKVTKYMDLQAEENVLTRYLLWAIDHLLQSNKMRGNEGSNKKAFFRELTINLCADMLVIRIEIYENLISVYILEKTDLATTLLGKRILSTYL